MTVLISSHLLSELSGLCTDFSVISHGNLIENLSHEELLIKCRNHIALRTDDINSTAAILEDKLSIHDYKVMHGEEIQIFEQLGVEYEERKKQLGTVISGISHDFRTPLTASLGYLQMIGKSGELSDKNAEYLAIAMQKNHYLKELSDEFFELTKIENSNDELQLEKVNLSNILTETVLEQHSWIAARSITTDFEIADGIVLQTDMHCLTRILNNLMSNAQKYTADSFGVTLKFDLIMNKLL